MHSHLDFSLSLLAGNEIYDNYDAGISLVETSRTIVYDNKIEGNKWGVRILLASTDNQVSLEALSPCRLGSGL